MRGERKETVTLVRACLQAAESIGTREQSRAHPSPSPAALKEKFYKGKDKILDPPPPALPHSVWAPPSTRLSEGALRPGGGTLASQTPQWPQEGLVLFCTK